MAKVTVILTKDFANHKKGYELRCDSMLASQLVHRNKVAKYDEATLEAQDKAKGKASRAEKPKTDKKK